MLRSCNGPLMKLKSPQVSEFDNYPHIWISVDLFVTIVTKYTTLQHQTSIIACNLVRIQ